MAYSVCVFCGSRNGNDEVYRDACDNFGRELAMREMSLVYGGGKVGLMGAVADGALDLGGHVVGVIPDFLSRDEVIHPGLHENLVVDDLFERKAMMIERADAFVALPGGIGTYDEVLEVIAWRQLRQLRQPIGFLNVMGYFDPFIQLLDHTASQGFLAQQEYAHLIVEANAATLLDALVDAPAP
jgi:uncharacterized protein (TIGR00730 family)